MTIVTSTRSTGSRSIRSEETVLRSPEAPRRCADSPAPMPCCSHMHPASPGPWGTGKGALGPPRVCRPDPEEEGCFRALLRRPARRLLRALGRAISRLSGTSIGAGQEVPGELQPRHTLTEGLSQRLGQSLGSVQDDQLVDSSERL